LHEIAVHGRELFLTSTGFDSVLGFNLDQRCFDWALHVQMRQYQAHFARYDPKGTDGPRAQQTASQQRLGRCEQPARLRPEHRWHAAVHRRSASSCGSSCRRARTARPFRSGVLFNDTEAGTLRYSGRDEREDRIMKVPTYDPETLTYRDADTSGIARQGFARGLCVLTETMVAGGSSPSTVTVYDLKDNEMLLSVNLTRDIRNAIHGLAVWPYG
jgi:hypothetical protein